jgi:glycosyltransferase involved in cell wall biosynthesis
MVWFIADTTEMSPERTLLFTSALFDEPAYRTAAQLPPAVDAGDHYLKTGWRQGLEPGPRFEGTFLYPFFNAAGWAGPPLITYLVLQSAGCPVYATRQQAEHDAQHLRTSGLFDAVGYAARARVGALDPALHYLIVGESMGYAPSGRFDPQYYGDRYPDIKKAGVNRLVHYLLYGRFEGRRSVSVATRLTFDRSRLDPARQTVLLVSHAASRTGAPILAYNIAMRMRHQYNVVTLVLAGGELIQDFDDCCAAVIGPVTYTDWDPVEAEYLVRQVLASYPVAYAIVNSIESRLVIPPLATSFVPVISLIHEFASYTRPKGAMGEGLDWSTQVVFSTDITANSAKNEHPHLLNRRIHVLPQGRCDVPSGPVKASSDDVEALREVFRPTGYEDALLVLGAGFVHIRKGIDLFLSCAAAVAAMRPKRPVRFIWIGDGYDVENDPYYSVYLAEQIARSGLEGKVAIIDAIPDLELAYEMSDIFFLSSRLDPLPNVTIDSAFHGRPIVCFENASGMATLLSSDDAIRRCVVPYLDVQAAARLIAELSDDETERARIGDATRRFAQATFDMDRYVRRLDELGREAIEIMSQRRADFMTLCNDPLFDESVFMPPTSTAIREEAIKQFLARWSAVGTSRRAGLDFYFRRPCAGFHPQIYAHENVGSYDTAIINPLAHFIRSGKPDGPWCHEVIKPVPLGERPAREAELRTGLHVHFYYPELAQDFLRKMASNRFRCDLLLSTNTDAKAKALRAAMSDYDRGEVLIRIVPNRGRDIGAFLTGFREEIVSRYDIVGHLHSKRSLLIDDAALGENWREFLWQNLLGDLYPMMDIILERFDENRSLGIVFPEDPHLSDWDDNLEIGSGLANRMGIGEPLPPFFDFPIGTMFWARPKALEPLFELKFGWEDFPEEPLPYDGTMLHALERLLPFVATHAGYRFATTQIPGVTR